MIPRTGGLFNRQKFKSNIFNEVKNAVALYTLASHNSLPGLDFSNVGKLDKFMRWPLLVFDTRSVKPKSWLAPLRAEALRTYKQLNTAIASGDKKTAHSLTTTAHKTRVTELMNKYGKENGYTYIWRFHREVVPTQVLSIRTVEGYLANEEPKFGNRMLIHALVKFDTEQSLQIYDRNGRPLHKPRKRVTEYLVMEKRMWYDMPWVFRDQMWPNASAPQSTA
ncbi:hypothetical protein BDQ17DRAFT_1347384 [Cyathus striatus]|nr:hypothetical protein BDQ17DRAFT_1347384 [Cyathus striatus]